MTFCKELNIIIFQILFWMKTLSLDFLWLKYNQLRAYLSYKFFTQIDKPTIHHILNTL